MNLAKPKKCLTEEPRVCYHRSCVSFPHASSRHLSFFYMTPQSDQLEFKGSLTRNPVAEILAEFSQKQVSGALRLFEGDKKFVIYLEAAPLSLLYQMSEAIVFLMFCSGSSRSTRRHLQQLRTSRMTCIWQKCWLETRSSRNPQWMPSLFPNQFHCQRCA